MTGSYQSAFANSGEFDLAPGSVFGLRWWHLTPSGLMYGAYGGSWSPSGENTAQCGLGAAARTGFWRTHPGHTTDLTTWHQAPYDGCECGFYAFWDSAATAPFMPAPGAMLACGVIEGYGRTLIGDKGFRCEKARIRGMWQTQTGYRVNPVPYHRSPGDIFGAWEQYVVPGSPLSDAGVPLYESLTELLAAHPLTTDYRPPTVDGPEPPLAGPGQ